MEDPKVMQNLGGTTPLQTQEVGSGQQWGPGPWQCEPTGQIRDSHGYCVARTRMRHTSFTELQMIMANRRLIAAAPELYEALEEIRHCFKYFVSHAEESDGPMMIRVSLTAVEMMHEKVLAVLAKARGESGEPDPEPVRSGIEPQDVK